MYYVCLSTKPVKVDDKQNWVRFIKLKGVKGILYGNSSVFSFYIWYNVAKLMKYKYSAGLNKNTFYF